MSAVVSLEGVGKRYVKYEDVPLLVTRALRLRAANRRSHMWALRNIDLHVDPGESVGVIGRNGSGKSTMLRMLAGVTAPTEGVVRVRGRVAPLISVGIGFHRELTGRENVYVNGIILGLAKREIDRLFDSIVQFAEIEEFIDTPVKFYSSGMFVRLGFAVAVASHPEVLLVDEVLAVGDLAFQRRCFDRMDEIRREGATILVVSHNMNAIRLLCRRTMLLHDGRAIYNGDTNEAISKYHDILGKLEQNAAGSEGGDIAVSDLSLTKDGAPTAHVAAGDEVTFSLDVSFARPARQPILVFRIYNESGQLVYGETILADPVEVGTRLRFDVRLRVALPTGSYTVETSVGLEPRQGTVYAVPPPLTFFVSGRPMVRGSADLRAVFDVRVTDDGHPHDRPASGSVAPQQPLSEGEDPGSMGQLRS